MKIYLVRHGQTPWNSEGRWQGESDIALDRQGMAQADKLGARFETSGIEYIYSSPLSRAKDTAKAIADKCGLEITYRDDLKEINVGVWSGMKISEVIEKYPAEIEVWENQPHKEVGLGIESYGDLQHRAINALKEICRCHNDNAAIAVVTHGAWIRAAVAYMLEIPLEKRMCFDVDNTSVSVAAYKRDKGKFKITLLNDTGHL